MKFTKVYHTLTDDPSNKWQQSWQEIVDVDPSHAAEENKNFDKTGVQYEAIEDADTPNPVPVASIQITDQDIELNPELTEVGLKAGDQLTVGDEKHAALVDMIEKREAATEAAKQEELNTPDPAISEMPMTPELTDLETGETNSIS